MNLDRRSAQSVTSSRTAQGFSWPALSPPSTLPKDSQGQAINEDRRERKAREAEFEAQHGRKMSKKDRKRLRGRE
jgi:hypothetical protein